MSELRLVERAEHPPNKCFRCERLSGPFLDLGITDAFNGQLYLCAGDEGSCVRQIARKDGMLDPEAAASYEVRLNDAADLIEELRGQLKEADRTAVQRFAEFLSTPPEPNGETPPDKVAIGQTPEQQ